MWIFEIGDVVDGIDEIFMVFFDSFLYRLRFFLQLDELAIENHHKIGFVRTKQKKVMVKELPFFGFLQKVSIYFQVFHLWSWFRLFKRWFLFSSYFSVFFFLLV